MRQQNHPTGAKYAPPGTGRDPADRRERQAWCLSSFRNCALICDYAFLFQAVRFSFVFET